MGESMEREREREGVGGRIERIDGSGGGERERWRDFSVGCLLILYLPRFFVVVVRWEGGVCVWK